MSLPLRAAIRPLVVVSGFCGLLFEVLWTRLLANVVGATALAMTAVFTVFILALAAGAFLAGRSQRRGPAAVRLFGILEAGAGASGLVVTLILLHHGSALAALGGRLAEPLSPLGAALVLSLGLLSLPTLLMGASLPVLLAALEGEWPAREAPVLYALNLLGGALGAAATGYFLIWQLGVTGTATLAAAADAAAGLAAFWLATRWAPAAPGTPAVAAVSVIVEPQAPGLLAATAFGSGLAAFTYELLWGRLSKLYLGDRTLATSTLLLVYLLCLAAGSLLVPAVARRLRPADTREVLLLTLRLLALGAVAHVLALRLVWEALVRAPHAFDSALPRVLLTLAAAAIPVTLSGTAFPLLFHTMRRVNQLPARALGRLTAVNSVGAALGAVIGGSLLPRVTGTARGFLVAAGAVALASVWADLLAGTGRRRLALVTTSGFLAAAVLAPASLVTHSPRETVVDVHEDEYGLQVVTRTARGYLKVKNDRSFIAYHLGAGPTSYTQEAMAYFPCLMAAECRDVLNIGTGYGITAGAFTQFPGVRAVTTVEVLPYVCHHQYMFTRFNFAYYSDPRVRRICGDGRHALARSSERYDVISVNVFDPYMPGSGALFTMDFWALARAHLAPGGVYAQLLWEHDVEMLAGGLRRVFPTVGLLRSGYGNAWIAVATSEPRSEPMAWNRERLSPAVARALQRFGLGSAERHVDAAIGAAFDPEQAALLAGWAADGLPRHTDDKPILEYRWWYGEERVSAFDALTDVDYE